MKLPPKSVFWHSTPPALFAPVLGLLGLGLAWRRAGATIGVGAEIGDLISGAAFLLYVFVTGSYVAKFIKRPGVILDDPKVLPGRAGLAAMAVSALLLPLVVAPVAPAIAPVLLGVGLAVQALVALLIGWTLATGPAEQRRVNPVWHLSFVGFIVGAMTAADLGLAGLAKGLLAATLALALPVYVVSAAQLLRNPPPPPLRPLLSIHLAPVSIGCTTASLLGLPALALGLALMAGAILLALLVFARWITVAGFSPFWGAFTFPLAAFAAAMLVLGGPVASALGAAALVAGTLAIPVIAARVLRAWMQGGLAAKTNAARA